MTSVFSEFVGQYVKAPYRDGNQFKIARGRLDTISNGFVKITGKLGTIVINEKNIEKMSVAIQHNNTLSSWGDRK